MIYVNAKTGATIETPCVIKAEGWALKAQPSAIATEDAKPEKKAPATGTKKGVKHSQQYKTL